MNCLICESTNIKNITKHRLLGYNIKKCENCNYAYVDTTNLSNENIYIEQVSKVNAIG